ncbi:MAG TPA: hypothetical protein VN641_19620 [Urbifossiella sp.]|nr:hypothetical protein [Urbifossiella sp.]
MAKPLRLEFQGQTVDFQLEKIDRTKLYGYVETEVLDENGKRCEVGTLTGDGHSIVGKGGTALAYFSPDGLWRKKTDLKPVDLHGNVIPPVKSTFDATVPLDKKASIDDYLSHNIHLVYRLSADDEPPALREELKKGTIFQFPFSYRGGVEASAGFLLQGSDGNLFLCVGTPTALEFVGLKTQPAIPAEDVDSSAGEEDLLDFSMV